ncbi:MAG TPA: ABC-type transport auxiliary lipoprotein family protein [Micavibrio sp.]|jgi:ABC-type uncharacterized transport system auxiliary subunit
MTKVKSFARFGVIALSACSLSACITLKSDREPPVTYMIHAAANAPQLKIETPAVINIPEPELPVGFSTDQIVLYLKNGRQLDYFAQARWPDELEEMLHDIIALSAQKAFPGAKIVTPDLDIPADYRLAATVAEFQPVYSGGPDSAPHLYEAIHFRLISLPAETIAAEFTISRDAMAEGNDLTSIVSGLESLLNQILSQAFETMAPYIRVNPGATVQ